MSARTKGMADKIGALAKEGLSVPKISAALGISESTIYKYGREFGLRFPPGFRDLSFGYEHIARSSVIPIDKLEAEELRKLIIYDPETGNFFWRIDGEPIPARKDHKGYRKICIQRGRPHVASRIAWFYMTGLWPTKYIDHINCVSSDDRFCNLREATGTQNNANRGVSRRNTSGLKGVTRARDRFSAKIAFNNKRIFLGTFDTAEEAHAAYVKAAIEHFGEFARAA